MKDQTTIYKFCGSHGVTILRDLEVLVQPPNQFNDPFEFTPRIYCSDSAEYGRRIFSDPSRLRQLHEKLISEGRQVGSFGEFSRIVETNLPALIAKMPAFLKLSLLMSATRMLNLVSETTGLLCMGERRDSILMWGHYCSQTHGLVIEFDAGESVFQIGGGFAPVNYSGERVPFDACWKNGSEEMNEFQRQIIFTKNLDWLYEREWRANFPLAALRKAASKEGKDLYFLRFPPSTVISVTLGPRSLPDFEQEIRAVLGAPHFSHVSLQRAVLDDRRFTLRFDGIDRVARQS